MTSPRDGVSHVASHPRQGVREEEDSAFFPPPFSSLVAANFASSRSCFSFLPYSVKTPSSVAVIRIGPPWFLRPSPGYRSIFSRCGGSFWCTASQARRVSPGLPCCLEVDVLSCREYDGLLLETGGTIDDDFVRVTAVGSTVEGVRK